jgi:hypothetical protein
MFYLSTPALSTVRGTCSIKNALSTIPNCRASTVVERELIQLRYE